MRFASRQNRCQQCNNKKWKSFASWPNRLSNYGGTKRTKSLAAFCPRGLSNYDGNTRYLLTSVDCWVLFYRSQASCSSHHLQQLVQVDCCISFQGSNICSIYFVRSFLLIQIESWGSMCSRNHFSNLQVDCNVFHNIPSLPQRLQYILWGRMGATAASQQTQRPCWPQP